MSNINFNVEEKLNRPVIALRGLWIYPYSVVHYILKRDLPFLKLHL